MRTAAALRATAICLLATACPAAALPPPPIQVTRCEAVVPARGRAVLAADLTCPPGAYGVTLGSGGRIDLAGHTISASLGILCEGNCSVQGPGSIGGSGTGLDASYGSVKVDGVDFTSAREGINARSIRASHSTFTDASLTGLFAGRTATITDSTFTNNAGACGAVNGLTLKRVTIVGGDSGVASTHVSIADSSIDTTTDGGSSVDILSAFPPRLRNSTCAGTSVHSEQGTVRGTWGICPLD